MKTAIEDAIKVLTEKINKDSSMDEALRFTQAALNLAHTLATLNLISPTNK